VRRHTATAIGTSRAKVERARAVLDDPEEANAVRTGKKTIHQAALDAKAKRVPLYGRSSIGTNGGRRSKTVHFVERDAIAKGHRIILSPRNRTASEG
jgi:hypothetical protein